MFTVTIRNGVYSVRCCLFVDLMKSGKFECLMFNTFENKFLCKKLYSLTHFTLYRHISSGEKTSATRCSQFYK
ncbi:Ovule protein [Caenorhabditis elegans]|uniref:Ovule protein n=1 Tax=Caenorhabditis elegans TaxID=6239 RepID=I2HAB4_CAEEL|nr:Ovule protein [Caenorhabditis elegans]CCH63821.1 Ovule protein [Caenorhabditis elegans]|eukprot:NP_001255600.1 Uncharacterized protein CELE_ZK822.10 [Caenorhabditis elegans]